MNFARKIKRIRRNKSAEDKRLALLAQELGVAGMMVLINDYGFSREQANEWFGKMLEQAKTNRLMLAANTSMAVHDLKRQGKI